MNLKYESMKRFIESQEDIDNADQCYYFHYILTYPQCDFLSHGDWHYPCRIYNGDCPLGHKSKSLKEKEKKWCAEL